MWKYIGNGFLPGLPARDLSDDEVKTLGLGRVKQSGLYKHIRDKKERPAIERENPAIEEREKE